MTVAIWRGFFSTNIRSEFQFLKILVHEEVKAYYKKTQFNNACINFLNRNITRDDVAIFGPDGKSLLEYYIITFIDLQKIYSICT